MLLGDIFPNLEGKTTHGDIKFHDWLGDSWGILFSHPADFTPVCTTELAEVFLLREEFKKRNCKVIALSCDSVDRHQGWSKDVAHFAKLAKARKSNEECAESSCDEEVVDYPIIADESRAWATALGMYDAAAKDKQGLPLTCRAVFIIGPDKKLKLEILYPATTGRNFKEVVRVLDSLQLTHSKTKLATPVDWEVGEPCILQPNVKNEELPTGSIRTLELPSGKPYLRYVDKYDDI